MTNSARLACALALASVLGVVMMPQPANDLCPYEASAQTTPQLDGDDAYKQAELIEYRYCENEEEDDDAPAHP